ncbi:MAG: NAD(P) transhydrogenase subunit alpha [Firmicutes bacterium ADurb.Bin506]|nr:MAG: NAD(P) transhydrogenase subunit alpha [Firmicutes bacterium ADurb.Bin506]
MSPLVLVILFVVSSLVGYKVISAVPSLLHTPLMSGSNALSGITILGALTATAIARMMDNPVLAQIAGFVAIVLAMVNVVGGFVVTDRMLRMFHR